MAGATTVSPLAQRLARQVLAHEGGEGGDSAAQAAAAERACARLGERLAGLIGHVGFQALLARALRLARDEVPTLALVTFDPWAVGALRGLPAFLAAQAGDPATATAGLTAILAQLIGLLVIFIGEPLTVRVVRGSWPDLSLGAQDLEERP